MASEALYVPEDNLEEVIRVIRAGCNNVKVSKETKAQLRKWCDEMEEYLNRD